MISHRQLGKIGLVLPSGFMKGAFQAGALKAFEENDVIPSYIVGVSAGAINGAAFASGQIDALIQTYADIAHKPHRYLYNLSAYTLFRAFFWTTSILTNSPLREVITFRINPQALAASPITLEILTTDFQEGVPRIFSNKHIDQKSTDALISALLASSAMPTVFPPVEYGGHQLFDGAIVAEAPISYALRQECDTIFVILNDSRENLRSSLRFRNIFSIARRTSELFGHRTSNEYIARTIDHAHDAILYREFLEEMQQVVGKTLGKGEASTELKKQLASLLEQKSFSFKKQKQVSIHVIDPGEFNAARSTSPSLIFDRASVLRDLESGYKQTQRVLHRLNLLKK